MNRIKLVGFVMGFATVASIGATTAFASTTPTTYTVQSGDTLWKIAQKYQLTTQNLVTWNNLQNAAMIYPNEVLTLQQPQSTTYTVQSGDSLWKIAQANNVTVQDLVTWNQISDPSTIYVGQKLTIVAPTSSGSSTTTVSGSVLVSYAKQFLGVPYQWGGESTSGFDCSGLVQYVFAHFGVSLPRTAATQATVGKVISESDLTEGDLVFFNTTGSTYSHVGIYVGSGDFISATDHGVRISALSNSYWAPRFTRATNPQG